MINYFTLTKEELYDLYITKNYTYKKIAEDYGYAVRTVLKWLNIYGIKKDKSLENANRKKAFIDKYGVDNPQKVKEFSDKTRETNKNKYGGPAPINNPIIKQKIQQTCLNKYGYISPLGNKDIHKQTMKISETRSQHINYEYVYKKENLEKLIKEKYYKKTIDEIAEDLDYSYTAIHSYITKYELIDLIDFHPPRSKYEREILNILNEEFHITNVITNTKDVLNDLEIDLFLPDYNIGIEFNGNYWHMEYNVNKLYHYNKSVAGENKNIFIFHIFEYEWINNKDAIINQLRNLLKCNTNKVYARQCVIKEVPSKICSKFLNENHRQKADKSKIKLGLYYNDMLVSVMTFTVARFNSNYNYELSRFCSLSNYNVVGGASKLFKYFVNNYLNINETVLSYSDISKTKGDLYGLLGFTLDHISPPNYIWWKHNREYRTRYQCQMKNEVKIMHELGYARIYDCGNKVWIYKKEN